MAEPIAIPIGVKRIRIRQVDNITKERVSGGEYLAMRCIGYAYLTPLENGGEEVTYEQEDTILDMNVEKVNLYGFHIEIATAMFDLQQLAFLTGGTIVEWTEFVSREMEFYDELHFVNEVWIDEDTISRASQNNQTLTINQVPTIDTGALDIIYSGGTPTALSKSFVVLGDSYLQGSAGEIKMKQLYEALQQSEQDVQTDLRAMSAYINGKLNTNKDAIIGNSYTKRYYANRDFILFGGWFIPTREETGADGDLIASQDSIYSAQVLEYVFTMYGALSADAQDESGTYFGRIKVSPHREILSATTLAQIEAIEGQVITPQYSSQSFSVADKYQYRFEMPSDYVAMYFVAYNNRIPEFNASGNTTNVAQLRFDFGAPSCRFANNALVYPDYMDSFQSEQEYLDAIEQFVDESSIEGATIKYDSPYSGNSGINPLFELTLWSDSYVGADKAEQYRFMFPVCYAEIPTIDIGQEFTDTKFDIYAYDNFDKETPAFNVSKLRTPDIK